MTKLYYTIFNLIALSLIIYCSVDIFYRTARSRIVSVKSNDISIQLTPDIEQYKKTPFSEFSIITKRNLFGSLEKASKEMRDEEVEGLEPTSLNLILLGTVSSDDRQNARAVIEEKGKREQGLYKEGDSIQDALVQRILREKVILRVGDKDEVLTMKEPSSPQESPYEKRAARDVAHRLSRRAPRTSTITVRRSDIQESIADINQLLSQARIQPHFKDGNADGLAISRIRRGSIFSKLGLRNGDVVQEVNGNPLHSPEDIFSLYEKLKSGDEASIQVTRRGRQRTLNYKFR